MSKQIPSSRNPLRVAAGRMNGRLRRPWTPADRARQRDNALRQQPWQFAKGPVTPEGRAMSAANGRKHVADPESREQARKQVADVAGLISSIRELRQSIRES